MIQPIAYVLAGLLLTTWLGFELKRPYNLRKHWGWLAAAFVVGVASFPLALYGQTVAANFVLHATGGVACTLIFVYVVRSLKLQLSWRLALFLLLGLTCLLGAVNELFEYAAELLGRGIYSQDTHDVWRDMAANITGMLGMWLLYSLGRLFGSRTRRPRV